MSRSQTMFVDTSILPSDIFNYHDYEFYSIVSQLTGSDEVELLRIQSIRTVNSFLRINNVFHILTIDSEDINNIKKQICFILNNNTYAIKSDIQGSIDYLRDLFLKKQSEISKRTNKINSYTDCTSSKITSSNGVISHEPTTTTTLTSVNPTDYHSIIVNRINEWCSKNGRDLNLLDLKLTEGTDYLLTVPSYNSDSAHIRCGCRASARLPRQGNNFQLSNYYRHLKTGKCSMLQSKFQSNPAQDNDTHDVSNDTIKKLSSDQTMIMEDTQLLSIDSNSTIRSKRTTTSSNHVHSKKKRQRKFM
ncbi:unnamed protein product [Rotaria magnacalcarata]|uniref:Uncharacterized protein n=2 Tax=Rotaria magnacalcarata TaxID=392030 RepID=A0A815W3I5_9BILA|nr:unnamed protein product [Rotaria magnacalcarata]CAF2056087.1 unnamed protein product [Rotaria magnacalcarata]CAF2206900.1 unnamed protein product [Rotaria magnacalcarata]